MSKERVTIIGAGITGLACAHVLSSSFDVTIMARDLPGDLGLNWASPWAGAVFHHQRTTDPMLRKMQRDSFDFYHSLANSDASSGVKIYPMTEYFDTKDNDSEVWYKDLVADYHIIPKSDLPSGITFGVKYTTLGMNPQVLLPWLRRKLEKASVEFIRREVASISQARALTGSKLIVNASGVGAQILAHDEAVRPVRGQTMFVKTDFEELAMLEGTEYTYVIPRAGSGGAIIGGIKSDRLDADVDAGLRGDILRRVNRITNGAFKDVDLNSVEDIIGFRPGRKGGPRVEREGDVVHAYGVEGAGYIYSFGVAARVKTLLEGGGRTSKL
ncbi:hypothetical protein BJ875DRAFT_465865 [Amylocarpus encephaloides]|uniref:FAD dependent oxidoreductase domain-containing protein n=1 Tax=Amylocarpus encephaloides TaxID=45428 RepID=A0A9P7YGS7_9HELO|nr:hypothetical protein BJ875DRAFT_465865 [Amylocarpus encephaloides]